MWRKFPTCELNQRGKLKTCPTLLPRFANPALRDEIDRKASQPMSAFVMLACNRRQACASMGVRRRNEGRTIGIL